jgi:tetratricopeptide (TPR) repeat protein
MKCSYFIAITVVAVVCACVFITGCTEQSKPASAVNQTSPFQTANTLYSKSVDLATAGNYKDALQAADLALAQNVSTLIPTIQANRAAILVELKQYNDAITAADSSIATGGNLTVAHSIAWFEKAEALYALNLTQEARAAYANATALDPMHQNIPARFP